MSNPIIPREHVRLLVWLAGATVKELREVAVDDDDWTTWTDTSHYTRQNWVERIVGALTRDPILGSTSFDRFILGQLVERGLVKPEAVR